MVSHKAESGGLMQVKRFAEATGFMALAGDFLLKREALNNLLLGIMSTFRTNPGHYVNPYFAVVQDFEEVVAAAIRTPPHDLILAETDRPDALSLLAEDALDAFGTLPGVQGPKALTGPFMALWQQRTGQEVAVQVSEGIYELTAVTWPKAPSGRLRQATERDRALLLAWFTAFQHEVATGIGSPEEAARRRLERFLGDDTAGLWLWEDGGPVSLVGSSGPTGSGIRVGPVYTPPAERHQGYASQLTAEVSQHRLNQGYRRVFLFTDLANPTSNKIYQAIGYRLIGEVDQCRFLDPAAEIQGR